jgi:lysozyme
MKNELAYSPAGLLLTQDFEKCRLVAYQDSKGVWTIGWGHTAGVKRGDVCTQAQADAWLLADVQDAVYAVNHYVAIKLRQNEFDALVDFVFNVGAGNFANSTLLRKLNRGDLVGAANEFERWDMSGGVHLSGLLRRRKAEEAMFELGSSTA